jgi:hypothetical protein
VLKVRPGRAFGTEPSIRQVHENILYLFLAIIGLSGNKFVLEEFLVCSNKYSSKQRNKQTNSVALSPRANYTD